LNKFRYLSLLICVSMILFLSAGCNRNPEKPSEISLKDLIDLSDANISNIKTSEGGGIQTTIENPKQIQTICSFLSKIVLKNEYQNEKDQQDASGGLGAYFLITYANHESSHIEIKTDVHQIKLRGQTQEGAIENGARVYSLSDSSQITDLDDVLSLTSSSD